MSVSYTHLLILSSSIVKRVTEANGSDAFEVQSVFEGGEDVYKRQVLHLRTLSAI